MPLWGGMGRGNRVSWLFFSSFSSLVILFFEAMLVQYAGIFACFMRNKVDGLVD